MIDAPIPARAAMIRVEGKFLVWMERPGLGVETFADHPRSIQKGETLR